jgi:hypothetical protein
MSLHKRLICWFPKTIVIESWKVSSAEVLTVSCQEFSYDYHMLFIFGGRWVLHRLLHSFIIFNINELF